MNLRRYFPDYPRTKHLPWKPNTQREDLVASEQEAAVVFQTHQPVCFQEKLDGANCGMMLLDGEPVLRNRTHILTKGYVKDTPAKLQFRPAWNWFYENKKKFEKLNSDFGGPVGVYGEWLYALHGIRYDALPSYFIAFDLYDPEIGKCLDLTLAQTFLNRAGFHTAPRVNGPTNSGFRSWEELEACCNEMSAYSTLDQREGVYVKVSSNDGYITHRFKMVRQGYVQGCRWNDKTITKNALDFCAPLRQIVGDAWAGVDPEQHIREIRGDDER